MDEQLIFQIQGSAPNPFRVTFRLEAGQLSATCTCNAGLLGKLCKHRLGLLQGEPLGIVSGNEKDVPRIQGLFRGTEVEGALTELLRAEAVLSAAHQDFTEKKLAFLALVKT